MQYKSKNVDSWNKRVETFERFSTIPWNFGEVYWVGIWDITNFPYEKVNARLNQLKNEMIPHLVHKHELLDRQ